MALGELVEGWSQFELEPAYILDLGDRVLSFGFQHATISLPARGKAGQAASGA